MGQGLFGYVPEELIGGRVQGPLKRGQDYGGVAGVRDGLLDRMAQVRLAEEEVRLVIPLIHTGRNVFAMSDVVAKEREEDEPPFEVGEGERSGRA